jgi:hypothetical protein
MTTKSTTDLSTINDVEHAIQAGLEALRHAPLSDIITQALTFLAPEGFTPVIQLEDEDGRKKRNTASASNWSPKNGDIRIYFEPKPEANSQQITRSPESRLPEPHISQATNDPVDDEIRQCCEALAEAEKAGKHFIALTWFRDKALPAYRFPWTASTESRQRVIAKAIDGGAITTGRIRNPRSNFETTTVSLNRSGAMSQLIPPRFRPVPVRGESVSSTIMRERGSL